MSASIFLTKVGQAFKSNSPEILTGMGVTGVITTSYFTSKAAVQAHEMIRLEESVSGTHGDRRERLKERTKLVWKCYIPPVVCGAVTIGCIIGASKSNARRTAAAVTAYSVTEKAFSEYKEKVIEEVGKNKEQKIHDEVVRDRVENNPPGSSEVIVIGNGQVLCCELYTHRYFKSDMEALRKAQNDINAQIVNGLYVTLDEFYDLVGLSHTSSSNELGWDSDRLMELRFTTVLAEGGEPCLAFEYNYVKPLD